MKVQMKAYFPGRYALVVAEKMHEQGIPVTIKQIYNFFNNVPVKKRTEILSAATLVLTEAKKRRKATRRTASRAKRLVKQ